MSWRWPWALCFSICLVTLGCTSECEDSDGDGVCDAQDRCPNFDDFRDTDGDGIPNGCDECVGEATDSDGDGVPDGCDMCDGDDGADADGDGVPDACDECAAGADYLDGDRDGVPDACDLCPFALDTADADGDGVPDACDACEGSPDDADSDGDGVPDGCDVCAEGNDVLDTDGDGVPNACDTCAAGDGADDDGDGVANSCDVCEGSDDADDEDDDGVPLGCERCESGDDALDADGDGVPDACDRCAGRDDALDADGDGVPDGCDVCAGFADGEDADGDGVPDGCDICAGDETQDSDGDGVPDACDTCEGFPDDADVDADGVPDACDACGIGRALADSPLAYWRMSRDLIQRDITGRGHDAFRYADGDETTHGVSEDGDPAVLFQTGFSRVAIHRFVDFPRDEFTVGFWTRFTSSDPATFLSFATDRDADAFVVGHDALRGVNFVFEGVRYASSRTINDGQDHHVAFTWSAASGSVLLYVDGVNVAGVIAHDEPLQAGEGTMMFGWQQASRGPPLFNPLIGMLDEAAIYERRLTPAEITAHYEAMRCTTTSCAAAAAEGRPSGAYLLDPDEDGPIAPFVGVCDMVTDGGAWLLVLNYLHAGGTNPPLRPLNSRLPVASDEDLGSAEHPHREAFGHASPAWLNALHAAGDGFTETRFFGRSSAHARVIDFATTAPDVLPYFRTGLGSVGAEITSPAHTRLLSLHRGATLPLAMVGATFNLNHGDFAMTEFPFFGDSSIAGNPRAHWGIRAAASRWEVDDFRFFSGPVAHTHHQVWVR